MTFSTPRFNNNYQYELVRLCWNSQVVGGTEKLFKYFIENYNPENIITYCDLSKFTGAVYDRIGFTLVKNEEITEPNYVWVHSKKNTKLTRYQTQKHKLVEQGFGTIEQTEDEIMKSLGFLKIYDCGNFKFEWKRGE